MEVLEGVVDGVENVLSPFGLMTGEYAVAKRIVVGALLGGLLITWIKPDLMFSPNGKPKPWKLLDPQAEDATQVPWYFVPFLFSIILGVFI